MSTVIIALVVAMTGPLAAASTAGTASASVTDTCGEAGSFPCAHHVYGSAHPKVHLVFLGDSYASGLGAAESPTSGTYNSGPPCYQSSDSYAGQVANQLDGLNVPTSALLAACSGATTTNVMDTQLQYVQPSDAAVVVSAGGDDIHFPKLAMDCEEELVPNPQECFNDFKTAEHIVETTLYQSELTLYDDILDASRNKGTLFVMGYPDIFPANGSTCVAAGPELAFLNLFSPSDVKKIEQDANTLVGNLDVKIDEAANAAYAKHGAFSVDFIDPRSFFASHNVCSSTPWINGVTLLPVGNEVRSLHPNYRGNTAFTGLVLTGLANYVFK